MFSKSLLLSLTALASFSHIQAAPVETRISRRQDYPALTDQFLFVDSITTFINDRRNPQVHADVLIWESDGCSVPSELEGLVGDKDKPYGFDFLASCHRHDFGYRNYKQQGRWTPDNRKRIDEQFKEDMEGWCNARGFGTWDPRKALCIATANAYYSAVRLCGNGCGSDLIALADGEALDDVLKSEPELNEFAGTMQGFERRA